MQGNGTELSTSIGRRSIWLFLLVSAALAWRWQPLVSIFSLLLNEGRYEHYSHAVLIPFLSSYLLYLRRQTIFAKGEWNPWLGIPLIGLGVVLSMGATIPIEERLDALSPQVLSIVIIGWGSFIFCYGTKAFRAASFGLSLLVFMVPIPSFLLDVIIGFLRGGTAEGVDFLFQLFRVPVFRQDIVFTLSNISIEIAKECSGIRSSIALFICSLVAGHLFLRSPWTRLALIVVVVPLTIIKNSIRIVVLSLLGNYVDSRFLIDSALHHQGGIPLFFVSLVVLLSILWILRRSERPSQSRSRLALRT